MLWPLSFSWENCAGCWQTLAYEHLGSIVFFFSYVISGLLFFKEREYFANREALHSKLGCAPLLKTQELSVKLVNNLDQTVDSCALQRDFLVGGSLQLPKCWTLNACLEATRISFCHIWNTSRPTSERLIRTRYPSPLSIYCSQKYSQIPAAVPMISFTLFYAPKLHFKFLKDHLHSLGLVVVDFVRACL